MNISFGPDIPPDLTLMLGKKRKCDMCMHYFLEHYHEMVFPALYTPIGKKLPLYWALCSTECAVQLKKTVPVVTQASIVKH